jgi:hypothetical protein
MPLEGQSLAYTFAKDAPREKKVQYYEMLGSRAIWADGWTAVTWHKPGTDWSEDKWELYNQDEDFTQATDLADKAPAKLKELIDLWHEQARRHNVFPLDENRGRARNVDPTRPRACEVRPAYTYYPGTEPVPTYAVPNLQRRHHRIAAHMRLPEGGAQGVIMASGSRFGGWSLFLKDGRAHYVHNCMGMSMHHLASTMRVPAGEVVLEFEFAPTGSQSGRPLDLYRPFTTEFVPGEPASGDGRMWINGSEVGRLGKILTAPLSYSYAAEGFQIGENWGTPVAYEHYEGAFPFTGVLHKVVVDVAAED